MLSNFTLAPEGEFPYTPKAEREGYFEVEIGKNQKEIAELQDKIKTCQNQDDINDKEDEIEDLKDIIKTLKKNAPLVKARHEKHGAVTFTLLAHSKMMIANIQKGNRVGIGKLGGRNKEHTLGHSAGFQILTLKVLESGIKDVKNLYYKEKGKEIEFKVKGFKTKEIGIARLVNSLDSETALELHNAIQGILGEDDVKN